MSTDQEHIRKLLHMFEHAAIQETYGHQEMSLSRGKCNIIYPVQPSFFHGAQALHGSVYFKLLDDACYFSAATLEKEYFILTVQFDISLYRPVTGGILSAEATVTESADSGWIAEGVLSCDGRKVAAGKGSFRKGPQALSPDMGYR